MTIQNDLDIKTLENWLWEAACIIRGPIDAPKYKDYILPLIFLKRLSDVFEDEINRLSKSYGSKEMAEQLLANDHNLVRFYLPPDARWESIAKQTTGIGEYLTDAVRKIAKENPKLQSVIDIVDFNATAGGQRIISDEVLKDLIDVLGKYRLGLNDVEPDILGRAYEYLLRKFAEGSGQSAGEFYTPGEVAILMSYILDPKPGNEIYDPCCGSGGLLINAAHLFEKGRPKNFLSDENINRIANIYLEWKEEEGISKIIPIEEAARNDYNLSPSRYVAQNGKDDTLPLEDAVVQLKEAEEERQKAD
ncbi:MAG TPA: class I SAM-dependent DNA methyltransferase, partial [Dysgonamonadaceae bacterium]|nr:class I SAM-dependent DNA methyltransferase [Dysgonamonadaceae bacterium]